MLEIRPEDITEAAQRLKLYTRKTPLIYSDILSAKFNKDIWLKCENLQRTGSFKFRGAANFILYNLPQAKKSGVVTASAGNHSQGVAAICQLLGISATIVMPQTTPVLKIQNTQGYGAQVVLHGQIYDEAYEHAQKLSELKGFLYVPAFKSKEVIAGQGTAGFEITEDLADFDAVIASVGGGGLISGIGIWVKSKLPNVKVYAVGSQNAPALYKSFHSGKIEPVAIKYTIAEGAATKRPEPEMLKLLKDTVDNFFSLSESSITNAITLLSEKTKLVAEGAGALPVAALLENCIPEKRIVIVLSGGNIDMSTLSAVLQRGLVEQGRIVRLRIMVTDRPGSLNSITQILAEKHANIIQVHHQRATILAGFGETEIEFDIETRGHDHCEEIIQALTQYGFTVHKAA